MVSVSPHKLGHLPTSLFLFLFSLLLFFLNGRKKLFGMFCFVLLEILEFGGDGFFLLFIFIGLFCVYVHIHARAWVWGSKGNLSFHHVDPQGYTEVLRLGASMFTC